MYSSKSNGNVCTWNRAQNGHSKSENSIIVIGVSGFPIIGSSLLKFLQVLMVDL